MGALQPGADLTIGSGENFVSFKSQIVGEAPEDRRIVFNDQYLDHDNASREAGIRIENVLPLPGAL